MKLLDLTLASPAENLACEEALLDFAEDGAGGEALRFWEPREPFVVVGYANKVATEVNAVACADRGVPILRRCSGGGTVLQGPGCLNYALVLRIEEGGPLQNISSANQFIMKRNRAAIESALHTPHSAIQVQGHTDLTLDGRKFSGNSQRRRRRFLLFHGVILLHANLALISELLPMPSAEPGYRAHRPHAEFLTNLNLSTAAVKTALAQGWNATAPLSEIPHELITNLAREKYATREWSFKF
jgi:lipoate-protein ligase A